MIEFSMTMRLLLSVSHPSVFLASFLEVDVAEILILRKVMRWLSNTCHSSQYQKGGLEDDDRNTHEVRQFRRVDHVQVLNRNILSLN